MKKQANTQNYENIETSKKLKLVVILSAIFFSAGSHYSNTILASLKKIIKNEYQINNTQFSSLFSIVSTLNTILPFVGGVLIDRYGTKFTSISASFSILLGNALILASSFYKNYEVLLIGRVIHGLGSGVIITTQQTVLSYWFKSGLLTAVIGLQLGSSRFWSFLASIIPSKVTSLTKNYNSNLWISLLLCFISFLVVLLYEFNVKNCQIKSNNSNLKDLKEVFKFDKIYWMLPLSIFVTGGIITPYLTFSTEFLVYKFDFHEFKADVIYSINYLIPIFLSPALGGITDKIGYKLHFLIFSSIMLFMSITFLSFTTVTPIISHFLISLSGTISPLILASCIPLILNINQLSTGIGLYKCFSSLGGSLITLLSGFLQDSTKNEKYNHVMNMLFVLCVIWLIISMAFLIIDKLYYNQYFNKSVEKRELNDINYKTIPNNEYKLFSVFMFFLFVVLFVLNFTLLAWGLISNPLKNIKLN